MTSKLCTRVLVFLVGCGAATPQGRPIDWPSSGGDAQRTGWEKVDTRITKDNVKDFQLVMKRKLEDGQMGPHSVTPPVMIGLLISYRGFKELAFVAGSSGNLWAIDVDLDRIFWHKHFEAGTSGACGGIVITPSLLPPMNFAARPRPGAGTRRPGAEAAPGAPPARPEGRGILGAGGFGAPRPLFFVSSDGMLHLMNTSTGDDVVPAMAFLPPDARASNLTVVDNTVYTTTSPDCGEGAVWAIDLNASQPKPASYDLVGQSAAGLGGLALGTDGTVYVQTNSALLSLTPKVLKLKQSLATPASEKSVNATRPVVFAYKGRDLIVTAAPDRKLWLLDSKSLDKPLYQTPPVASEGHSIWGGLSSWEDSDGTRWVLAPVWGPVSSELNFPSTNGGASSGAIVAFKVEDKDGKPVLTPAWVSRDMNSPEPPVITAGLVFALASGSPHATLYALDASTGKELYSTGDQVTAPGNLNGITLANGRVFFSTTDGTLYGFGIYLER